MIFSPSGYYDYDDYYNNMQGYEAYMQKWAIYSSREKTLNILSSAGTEEDLILGVDKIAWPYILSGLWCAFFSLCYAVLGIIFNMVIWFDIKI